MGWLTLGLLLLKFTATDFKAVEHNVKQAGRVARKAAVKVVQGVKHVRRHP